MAQLRRAEATISRDASAPAPEPTQWCTSLRPLALARATDERGHLWALFEDRVVDEDAPGMEAHFSAPAPCPHQDEAHSPSMLYFARGSRGAGLLRGRLVVAHPEGDRWSPTSACTDLAGLPFSPRAESRGWALLARRGGPRTEHGLLFTDDATGQVGWYAVQAADSALTHAVLHGDGSFVGLTTGHLILFDRERHAAGAVASAAELLFADLAVSNTGLVATGALWEGHLPVVSAAVTGWEFHRSLFEGTGADAVRVFQAPYQRFVAVAPSGIYWTPEPAGPLRLATGWTANAPTASALSSASLGWHHDGGLVVALPDRVIHQRCPSSGGG